MHEGMHMTQMQFTNTGAREIVSFFDTTFGQHGTQRMFFKKATRTLRRFAKVRGSKTKPTHDAYAKGTTRGCT